MVVVFWRCEFRILGQVTGDGASGRFQISMPPRVAVSRLRGAMLRASADVTRAVVGRHRFSGTVSGTAAPGREHRHPGRADRPEARGRRAAYISAFPLGLVLSYFHGCS